MKPSRLQPFWLDTDPVTPGTTTSIHSERLAETDTGLTSGATLGLRVTHRLCQWRLIGSFRNASGGLASLLGAVLANSVAFPPASALAQEALPPVSSVVSLDLLGDATRVAGAVPGILALSKPFSSMLFEAQATGRAETFGYARPTATAEVEVTASRTRDDVNALFQGTASSSLRYWMQIRERRPPPITFQPQLRVHADIIGEASVMHSGPGGGGASASAAASVGSFAANAQALTGGNLNDSFNESFVFAVMPGERILLTVSANATAGVGNPPDGFSSGMAIADPTLRFDEEAFAEYLTGRGVEPFLQADYYDFEFSDGLLVPEPSTATLALSGVLAMLIARLLRRRTISRRNTGRSVNLPISGVDYFRTAQCSERDRNLPTALLYRMPGGTLLPHAAPERKGVHS
jgi:hypothetical protein